MNSSLLRERKSNFVRLFDKTPPEVICPHFYELILSNGCPYNCSYCYLKLTLCKETDEVWKELGWTFQGCNCIGSKDTPSSERTDLYTLQSPLPFFNG